MPVPWSSDFQLGVPVGGTPTAPATGQVGDGMDPQFLSALTIAFQHAARDSALLGQPAPAGAMRTISILLPALLHNADGLVPTAGVEQLLRTPAFFTAEGADPAFWQHYVEQYFTIDTALAGETIATILAAIDAGVYVGSRTRAAQQQAQTAAHVAQQAAQVAADARAAAQAQTDQAAAAAAHAEADRLAADAEAQRQTALAARAHSDQLMAEARATRTRGFAIAAGVAVLGLAVGGAVLVWRSR